MNNTKEILQNARQSWVIAEIGRLKLEFPVADISNKTGYDTGLVSLYVNGKRNMAVSFMKAFCKAYNLDFEEENQKIIDGIKDQLNNDQNQDKNINKRTVNDIPSRFTKNEHPEMSYMEDQIKWLRGQIGEERKRNSEQLEIIRLLARKLPDIEQEDKHEKTQERKKGAA